MRGVDGDAGEGLVDGAVEGDALPVRGGVAPEGAMIAVGGAVLWDVEGGRRRRGVLVRAWVARRWPLAGSVTLMEMSVKVWPPSVER